MVVWIGCIAGADIVLAKVDPARPICGRFGMKKPFSIYGSNLILTLLFFNLLDMITEHYNVYFHLIREQFFDIRYRPFMMLHHRKCQTIMVNQTLLANHYPKKFFKPSNVLLVSCPQLPQVMFVVSVTFGMLSKKSRIIKN